MVDEIGRARPSELDERGFDHWDAVPFLEKVTGIAPSVIYVFNQRTQSNEYSNRSLGESLGYEAAEIQAMGADFMPLLAHPDDLPAMGEHFEAIRGASDGQVLELVYRIRHKDGGWRWLLSRDTVFDRDEHGQVVRHLGVANDITAQKQGEEALERANHLLATVNDELAELAYVATHDMRGPIANMSGLVELLVESLGPLDAEQTELVQLIRESSARATERIRDVVRVTQARAADAEVDPTPQPLAAHIDAALRTIEHQFRSVNGELVLDLEAPTVLFTDLALHSILENVLGNAVKYADPQRDLRVEVSSRDHGDAVVVTVADNGRGIDVERDGGEIFGLFKRGPSQEVPGSGIGLYMVRQMLRRGGGSVTVRHSPSGGAAFDLIFPQPVDR